MNENPILPKKFWEYVHKGPNCWEWTGCRTDTHGYFTHQGFRYTAHRIVCEGVTKSIRVVHTCGNSFCVNPEHIEVIKKPVKKIRKMPSNRHITIYDVHKIRSRNYLPSEIKKLAKEYGVTIATIYSIISRRTWKNKR